MKFKYAAIWLSVLCIIMFVLQMIFGTEPFLLVNSLKFAEPWRLVTAIFAHSGIVHILSNLFALLLFGLILEGRIGPKRVFWLFMISGILINIFSPYDSSLGASGAIYAIIGALVMLRPTMMIWMQGMPIPMILAGVLWFLQDSLGIFTPSTTGHIAHLTGIFIGFAVGLYWIKRFGDKHTRRGKKPLSKQEVDDWEEEYMR